MPYRDLKLFDVATKIADLVNKLIDESPRGRLLHVGQLRDAVQSIARTSAKRSASSPIRNLMVVMAKMLTSIIRG